LSNKNKKENQNMQLISFVLPIYNEEGNIPKLWYELQKLESELTKKYKVQYIFVNDFSSDKSLELLNEIYTKNSETVIVRSFSKNNGHQIAVTAGQDIASGDAIIIMDTDLQDPPMVCLDLIKQWEKGFDVVYAQRRKYKTNFTKEVSAYVFYRLMAKIANVTIPVDTGDFRLISKRVNEEMKKYKEKSKFLRGISCLVGFKHTAVQFDRQDRFAGKPGYTFQKSLKLAIDGITGFSTMPLRLISAFGFGLSFMSTIFGVLYVIYALITKTNSSGWASLIIAVFFLGGVQMVMLGILGEYIGRIYYEVLDRPLYTIDFELSKNKAVTAQSPILEASYPFYFNENIIYESNEEELGHPEFATN
jgi:polyisoprenyl-phosphate glycosyltransferase